MLVPSSQHRHFGLGDPNAARRTTDPTPTLDRPEPTLAPRHKLQNPSRRRAPQVVRQCTNLNRAAAQCSSVLPTAKPRARMPARSSAASCSRTRAQEAARQPRSIRPAAHPDPAGCPRTPKQQAARAPWPSRLPAHPGPAGRTRTLTEQAGRAPREAPRNRAVTSASCEAPARLSPPCSSPATRP
jgi:hypothetical protein